MKKLKFLIIALIILTLIIVIAISIIYREPKVPILCYHNVATKEENSKFPDEHLWTISVDNFEEEMKYLHDNNYKTLTMDEFYKWKKGEIEVPFKSVLITFDDGLLSNYYYAFPILKKYNINASVFVIGKCIVKSDEDSDEWDGNIVTYMSRDILKKCKEEYPNVKFYSHTYNLHNKGDIEKSYDDICKDCDEFNENIENSEYLAYPFGDYNDNIKQVLKDKKYKLAFTFRDNRKATRNDDDYAINRINVSTDKPLYKFALRLLLPY